MSKTCECKKSSKTDCNQQTNLDGHGKWLFVGFLVNTGNCHFAETLNYEGLVYRGHNLSSFCSNVQTSSNPNLYRITLAHPSYQISNIPDSPDSLQVPFSSNITMFF